MLEGDTASQLYSDWKYRNKGLTKHTFDKDITWCYEQLKEFNLKNGEDIVNQHIIMYDQNIKLARELGAITAANQAMQFKEKLLKLHAPDTQINIQNNTNTLSIDKTLSIEELKKLLND